MNLARKLKLVISGDRWLDWLMLIAFMLALALCADVLSGCSDIDHGNIPVVDLSIPI